MYMIYNFEGTLTMPLQRNPLKFFKSDSSTPCVNVRGKKKKKGGRLGVPGWERFNFCSSDLFL